jgi:hypothetical protein
MKHFVHYITREIKEWKPEKDSFFIQTQDLDDGFDRPMFHITRRKSGPTSEIKQGSIIWLFSILKSPWGKLPPSLDAKFIVEKVEILPDGKTKFHASKDSKWFPLFDASIVIQNLYSIDKYGKKNKLWPDVHKPLGIYLQSIRQLSNWNELFIYSDFITNSKFEFISYRIQDGTKHAFFATQNLIKNGSIIFWDRYNLPRRLVERRELVSDIKLDEYLMKKIESSYRVHGIETPKYSEENSYSLKEAELAKKLMKYSPINTEIPV